MRSKQLNFYLNASDQHDIDLSLMNTDDLVVCKSISPNGFPSLLDNTLIKKMGDERLKICLIRRVDLGEVIFRKIENQGYYSVDTLISPVIEYSRCFIGEGFIRRGRFFFKTSYYDTNDNLVSKDDSFISWADQIFKLTRKKLTLRLNGTRFGTGAYNDKQNGVDMIFM